MKKAILSAALLLIAGQAGAADYHPSVGHQYLVKSDSNIVHEATIMGEINNENSRFLKVETCYHSKNFCWTMWKMADEFIGSIVAHIPDQPVISVETNAGGWLAVMVTDKRGTDREERAFYAGINAERDCQLEIVHPTSCLQTKLEKYLEANQ